MGLIDELQKRANQNGDGRLSKEDLEALKDGSNNGQIDQLKTKADQNGDGKINMDDLHGFKDKLFGG